MKATANRLPSAHARPNSERLPKSPLNHFNHLGPFRSGTGLSCVEPSSTAKRPMDVLRQDLRYALRRLTRAPGFALVAILTLSLGVGANTAIFSIVNAVLFRRVPAAQEPDRLVALFTSDYSSSQYSSSSWPDYQDFSRESAVFSDVAALSSWPLNLARGNQLERVQAELVTPNYFRMLGFAPHAGRLLGASEDPSAGTTPVIVLSETFWRTRLAGDPSVIGSTLTVNGQPYSVVGIAAKSFHGLNAGVRTDAWLPIQQSEQIAPGSGLLEERGSRSLTVFARLRPGVSVAAAQARMSVLQNQLFQAYPGDWTRLNGQSRLISVLGERDSRVPPDARGNIFAVGGLLLGAVALVLLICCANVANLLLARAEARSREMGIRYSLGARRPQLLRQLMLESVVLALLGGIGGLLVSIWTVDLLMGLQPATQLPIYADLTPDLRVLLFNLGASLLTGLLFGLAPALQGTRSNLVGMLRGASTVVRRRLPLRDVLVAGQIAIALTLAVVAGLFARTLSRAGQVDVGLEARNVSVARMDLYTQGYDAARAAAFYRDLRARLEARPDVEATTLASRIELANPGGRRGVQVAGHTPQPGEEMEFPFNVVESNYFDVLRIRMMQGRGFTPEDRADSRPVIIVNETFARRFWPGQNPIGKRITAGRGGPREVVGVARDGKYWALNEAPRPFFYLPYQQQPRDVALLVRTRAGGENTVQQAIRAEVRARDPLLPILVLDTMEGQMSTAVLAQRVAGLLVGAFALLAVLLATIGVYGVTSVLVAQRIPEIGLRIALGARTSDVLGLVVRRTLLVAGVGTAAGLLLSSLATRGFQSLLFGVSRFDPLTLVLATTALGAAAVLAGYLPARRATRVDPLVALKG